MAKIILFENIKFEGHSLEVTGAERDLRTQHFNDNTSSVIVVSGQWTLYQHPDYGGKAWTVSEVGGPSGDGTYSDSNAWKGKGDSISSVKPS